jgi:hypothetical protein
LPLPRATDTVAAAKLGSADVAQILSEVEKTSFDVPDRWEASSGEPRLAPARKQWTARSRGDCARVCANAQRGPNAFDGTVYRAKECFEVADAGGKKTVKNVACK